jgi:hypothetical protein
MSGSPEKIIDDKTHATVPSGSYPCLPVALGHFSGVIDYSALSFTLAFRIRRVIEADNAVTKIAQQPTPIQNHRHPSGMIGPKINR